MVTLVNTGNGKNVKNMNTLKQENGNRKITKSEIELKMNTKIFPFTTTSQYPSHKKDVNVISLVEFKALTQDSFKKEEYCLDPTEFSENFVSTSSIFSSLTEMMHKGTTYNKLAYDHQKITLLVMILNSLNNEVLLKLLENSLGSELPYLSNLLVEQFHAEIGLFCLFYIELLLPKENDNVTHLIETYVLIFDVKFIIIYVFIILHLKCFGTRVLCYLRLLLIPTPTMWSTSFFV